MATLRDGFRKIANGAAGSVGSPWAFISASAAVIIWAAFGPTFQYSDTWQLVINTSTTIITFLMVFLIQNTQNRDARAIHLKLDELIRATKGARNHLMDLENLNDDELEQLHKDFCGLQKKSELVLQGIEENRKKRRKSAAAEPKLP